MANALTPEEVAALLQLIEDQKAEIARLRSEQSLYDVLREIAIDPAVPPHVRLKAAEAGVQFERPKLSATVAMFGGIGDRLDARKRERLRVIESEPEPAA
jgi:hypothetical protein